MRSRWITLVAMGTALGCGPRSGVTVSAGPTPSTAGLPSNQPLTPPTFSAPPASSGPTANQPEDEGDVEPERPLGVRMPERAIVHVHGRSSCSGVLVLPTLVLTSRRCAPLTPGAGSWRVQIAATTLTWTSRVVARVLTPACDVAVIGLVLAEASPTDDVLKTATAPGTGSRVRMLGFGRCKVRQEAGAVSSRDSVVVGIDSPMCYGDVGGAVLDPTNALVGVLAGAGHAEGDSDHAGDAPARHRTEAVRADGLVIRKMIETVRSGATGTASIACE